MRRWSVRGRGLLHPLGTWVLPLPGSSSTQVFLQITQSWGSMLPATGPCLCRRLPVSLGLSSHQHGVLGCGGMGTGVLANHPDLQCLRKPDFLECVILSTSQCQDTAASHGHSPQLAGLTPHQDGSNVMAPKNRSEL